METIKKFSSVVNDATKIGLENIKNNVSKTALESKRNGFIEELEKDSFIKIPFVGDFNAGKSSLLNSYIGIDLSPTNITPETAVSYELYYSTTERLEIWRNDKLLQTAQISDIKKLPVTPSDLVRVFINNDKVKSLNERGIVLVDMPGLDSGLEAHNNAILHYIQNGTLFVILTDADQATLRNSTISFLGELKEYGLASTILISKADKKPESALTSIKEHIEELAKRYINENAVVGITSAATGNFADLEKVLESIDAESIVKDKYQKEVEDFVGGITSELALQIKLAMSDKTKFEEKISQLKDEKIKALEDLKNKDSEAQPLEDSANDILEDVRMALVEKGNYLASMLFNSNNNTDAFNAEILSIVRPVLIKSFEREIGEYQEVISSSIREFAISVDEILQDKDNAMLTGANEIVANILGRDILEELLKKGLEKLAVRLAGYKGLGTLLKTLSKAIGPIVVIIINIIPDLLRLIFGKSKEEKISNLKTKLEHEVFGKIVEAMRPEIEKLLKEQRLEAKNQLSAIIETETNKYDDKIRQLIEEQKADEETIKAEVAKYEAAIKELNSLI